MGGASRRAILLAAAVCVTAAAWPARAGAQARASQIPFSDEAVAGAIAKARAYLWNQYRQDPRQSPWPDVRTVRQDNRDVPYGNYGGQSALVMFALLASGDKHTDKRMRRAVEWLAAIDSTGTYTLGIRMQVWTYLPDAVGRRLLRRDKDRLIKSIHRLPRGPAPPSWRHIYGTYGYTSADKVSDHGDSSNTHIGILGVWAAARMGGEVPRGYWELVFKHYLMAQSTDGSWRYGVGPGPPAQNGSYGQYPPGGMTAAGLANLLVAWENLHAADFAACGKNADLPAVAKAIDWLGANLGRNHNGYHYYLYALERVSLATGIKFFAGKDWYKLSATRLLNTQRADGSWARGGFGDRNDLVSTAFALIFLARGRSPVLFNRLQYNGDWNNRPNGLAYLCRWVSKQFEREINWQIVNLSSSVDDLHDAPVLLITGAKAPKFTDAELGRLRRFVHQGGMIFTVAECRGAAFDAAWRGGRGQSGLYGKLFGDCEIKPLPRDHPIYSVQYKMRRALPLWGVHNGLRFLALHSITDLPLAWQRNARVAGIAQFQLPVNISLFVNGLALGRPRGTSPWPQAKPFTPLRRATVARVRYKGPWDPEPLAWERFAVLMGRHWQTRLTVEAAGCGRLDPATHRVAHLTGATALGLPDAAKNALKAYVAGGGTLILEAAGGAGAFGDSAEKLIEELFGKGCLRRLPSFSPVYQMPGMAIASVTYRRAATKQLGKGKFPRILGAEIGGRMAVFVSKEDLTAGLLGYPSSTCIGYAPGTAEKPGSAVTLMRNMVLYGQRLRKPTTASRPATASAPAGK